MSADLLGWCVGEMERRFGLSVSEDIVQYILSIDTEEEIDEYINDLIQGYDEQKQIFINDLKIRWQRIRNPHSSSSAPIYRKDDPPGTQGLSFIDQTKKGRRKGRNKLEPLPTSAVTAPAPEEVKTPMDMAKETHWLRGKHPTLRNKYYPECIEASFSKKKRGVAVLFHRDLDYTIREVHAQAQAQELAALSSSKKKQKYVNLYTKEGQDRLAVLIPGRHACECLAQKHKLINNCITCGRIVCEQEGSGPCFFCDNLVCTKEEADILVRESNKSQKLRKKLLGGTETGLKMDLLPNQEMRLKEGLEKAKQHRDKLLEYDKTSVRRTHVIDDESDYFSTDSNQWLSQTEREALRKREQELQELRHASRLSRKVTIDFAGRKVLDEGNDLDEYHKRFDEVVHAVNSGTVAKPVRRSGETTRESLLLNPAVMFPPPVWVDQVSAPSRRRGTGVEDSDERSRLRIQDKELQEISDQGMCLSMHQPWASLLVAGIKRVEGRSWYSAHRGRLWIAAAAKSPSPQEISELETSYRILHHKDPKFPKDYPTSCLLGCVEVADCLPQEQFKEQYPTLNQESASPFVFICTNPQELLIKFPIKGQHKIWKLDSKIHQGAKKGLMFRKESTGQAAKSGTGLYR